jgi:hypothetical protein
MRCPALNVAAIASLALCLASRPGLAETGMGLIIDKNSQKIRRIDLQNDKIINTTAEMGSKVKHARFAPDGSKLVYSDEDKNVHVADLDGKVTKSFAAWNAGDVSWTPSGIWVGGQDKVVLYDPATGTQKKEVKVPGYVIRVVSKSETLATARTSNPTEVHAVLLDQSDKVIHGGGGCSNVPSPSGNQYTHNLWEDGKQHQTMRIENRSGTSTHYFYIFDLLPYPTTPDTDWTWNSQAWSSNSEDIIVIPAGRGYPQQTQSTVPWIYNLKTKKAVCLHADPKKLNVFWYIVDFYSGKVYECSAAAQCDDKNPCTQDSCVGNQCSYTAIDGCCTSDADCDDSDPCTVDTCDTAAGTCQHSVTCDSGASTLPDSGASTPPDGYGQLADGGSPRGDHAMLSAASEDRLLAGGCAVSRPRGVPRTLPAPAVLSLALLLLWRRQRRGGSTRS